MCLRSPARPACPGSYVGITRQKLAKEAFGWAGNRGRFRYSKSQKRIVYSSRTKAPTLQWPSGKNITRVKGKLAQLPLAPCPRKNAYTRHFARRCFFSPRALPVCTVRHALLSLQCCAPVHVPFAQYVLALFATCAQVS